MPTATLTFDLSDPHDAIEHLKAVHARDMALALSAMCEVFFSELDPCSEMTGDQAFERIRGRFHGLLDQYELVELLNRIP